VKKGESWAGGGKPQGKPLVNREKAASRYVFFEGEGTIEENKNKERRNIEEIYKENQVRKRTLNQRKGTEWGSDLH